MEHNAVMRPLVQLKKSGITYTKIPCTKTGELVLDKMKSLLRAKTKMIILLHASNVCGTLMPIKEIGNFARENNIFFALDTAQTAGVFPINMESMCIDALCFTGHKGLLGPQGIGGVILSSRIAKNITPLIAGGTGSLSDPEEIPNFLPDKFETGTLNLPGIYGLNASFKYLENTGIDAIRKREFID